MLKRALELLGPFVALALVILLFAVLLPGQFLSAYNLKTVATQTVIVGVCAIGMTFVIVSGGIDLSVGSAIALSSVVSAVLLKDGAGTFSAVLGGIAVCTALGAINGLIITRLRIVPFIVTLGSMGVARGLAKYLAGEQKVDAPVHGLSAWMAKTPDPTWLVLSPGVWLLFVLAALAGLVLARTVFGVHALATGSSEATARLCGIRVERVKLIIYALSGLCAGIAGSLQLARLTVGDPTTALGKELDVIAAVVIGGGSLSGGEGSVLGCLIGALIMQVLQSGCSQMGWPNWVQEIVTGAIIVLAVALDRFRHRR
jgi:ribose transport system permease protein